MIYFDRSDTHLQLHITKSKLHQSNIEKQALLAQSASTYNPEQISSSSDSDIRTESSSSASRVPLAAARRHAVPTGRMYSDRVSSDDEDSGLRRREEDDYSDDKWGRHGDAPPEEERWRHDRFLDVALDAKKITSDYASRWRKSSEVLNADEHAAPPAMPRRFQDVAPPSPAPPAGARGRGHKRTFDRDLDLEQPKSKAKGVAIPFTY